jgi:hypothetical protein
LRAPQLQAQATQPRWWLLTSRQERWAPYTSTHSMTLQHICGVSGSSCCSLAQICIIPAAASINLTRHLLLPLVASA